MMNKATSAVELRERLFGRMMPWQPSLMEDTPEILFRGTPPMVHIARGVASDVQVMTGVMDSEFTLFTLDPSWKRRFFKKKGELLSKPELRDFIVQHVLSWIRNDPRYRVPSDVAQRVAGIVDFYLNDNQVSEELLEFVFERIHSVWIFDLPAERLVQAHSKTARYPTFCYRVTHRSNIEMLKSPHALDLPLVFGNLGSAFGKVLAGDGPESQRVSREMMRAFTQFAKCGNPGFKPYSQGAVQMFGPPSSVPHDATVFQSLKEKRAWDFALKNVELSVGFFDEGSTSPARL